MGGILSKEGLKIDKSRKKKPQLWGFICEKY